MRPSPERDPRALSRRQCLQAIGLPALALGPAGAAQRQAPPLAPLNRFSRMVQDYFVGRVRAAEWTGLRDRASLRTKADAEAYVQQVRRKIQVCFGPFPPKTPLNPRVTGT